VRLRLSPKFAAASRKRITQIVISLPKLGEGDLWITADPKLTYYRGRLLSGFPNLGTAIYAAAFIRQRRIVLESALLSRPSRLRLILTHELFHFVWARLGNKARREFAVLLRRELKAGARGELGESSSVRKAALTNTDRLRGSTERWREYVCESFCDTAAWFYSAHPDCADFTLSRRWKTIRRRWFVAQFPES
jgi:hypothetical protein